MISTRMRAALGGAIATLALVAPATAAARGTPVPTTGVAAAISYNSASLTATVNPNGEATEYYFQYGVSTAYGAQTAPTELPAGTRTVAVATSATGLVSFTTYHYRVVAVNATGAKVGLDRTFKTAKIPLSLAITAAPNPLAFNGAVTVQGTLTGTGNANVPVTLEANAFPYTAGFVAVGNAELTHADGSFIFNVLSVALDTQYRVVTGTTVSPVVAVSVQLGVTLSAHAQGSRHHRVARFSGTVSPAEPNARIAFERLVGTSWKVVGGTIASNTVSNDSVAFKARVRIRRAGFYRALVLPVEGAHANGYSATVYIGL
jgi:hypothetical protein